MHRNAIPMIAGLFTAVLALQGCESASDPCVYYTACSEAGTTCDGNTLVTCTDIPGCGLSQSRVDCTATSATCFTNGPTSLCIGPCEDDPACAGQSEGDTVCADDTTKVTCVQSNQNTCLVPAATDCSPGACEDGDCVEGEPDGGAGAPDAGSPDAGGPDAAA